MEEQFDLKAAKESILEQFTKQGDFAFLQEQLPDMIDELLALDREYIDRCGAQEDGVYDDEEAFDFLLAAMKERHADYKAYMMRLVDDYMEYNEAYLDSIGAIEWDE